MRACILVLLSLFLVSTADRDVTGDFTGQTTNTISGAADGRVSFNYGALGAPPRIIVTASASTDITITALASGSLSGTFPSDGISSIDLSLTGKVGFRIQSSNSAASLTLQLVTADLSSLLTAGVSVGGVFRYDGSSYVAIPSTVSNGVLTATLPDVGDYVVATIQLQVSATFGVAKQIVAGTNRTYQWASDFAIQVATAFNNQITVSASATTALGTQQQRDTVGIELGAYYTISLQDETKAHLSTIRYTYTDAELTAKMLATSAAAKLRWATYNTASSTWQLAAAADCHVDLSAKVVAQSTTHFSDWGVYYSAAPTVSAALGLVSALVLMLVSATMQHAF